MKLQKTRVHVKNVYKTRVQQPSPEILPGTEMAVAQAIANEFNREGHTVSCIMVNNEAFCHRRK